MDLQLMTLTERLRSSLFVVPMAFLVGGLLLGIIGVEVDREIVDGNASLPFGLTSTVDSARSVLSTIASATITVAGIAFSVSLLVIQLASSQYSPRVVHGLLRDPFTKRVMGVVVATFTYCLVVLRSVRGPLEDGGDAVIPNLSVAVAVLLGVMSILAIIGFIDHSAQTMDVSRILARATDEALRNVELWEEGTFEPPPFVPDDDPPADHLVVRHERDGWIRHLDHDALGRASDPGGTVRIDTEVGRYAIAGTPLCTIWPAPEDEERAARTARDSVVVGASRTTEQDVGYGVRQLADVALRALSPGINDPTTALDALFHMGTVLRQLLDRRPVPRVCTVEGNRLLLRPEALDHDDLIELAFNEVRLAATGMPTVCTYILEVLHLLDVSIPDDRDVARAAIRRQAALVRIGADHADLSAHDAERIRTAHDRRFSEASAG